MTPIKSNVIIPKDHKLHLDIDIPSDIPEGDAEVTLSVRSLKTSGSRDDAKKALLELAESGGAKCFGDPDTWLQNTRNDKPLAGRE